MKARYCSARARIEIRCEVDLLAARELEQEVERTLEPVHVDEQSGLALGAARSTLDVLER